MSVDPGPAPAPLNTEALRKDFPLLARKVNGRPIVYLDSASSALQPQSVIGAMTHYYETTHANVHRGVYATAEESTALFERARVVAGRFLGAPDPEREIVFTKNTTESLNLVAHSWGRANLRRGDAVLLTEMEHHASFVPWMILSEELGGWTCATSPSTAPVAWTSRPRPARRGGQGGRRVGDVERPRDDQPGRLHRRAAHAQGAVVVADGAQLVPHVPTDIEGLGADFLAYSAHKTMGPTGLGVLWGRACCSRRCRRSSAVAG